MGFRVHRLGFRSGRAGGVVKLQVGSARIFLQIHA